MASEVRELRIKARKLGATNVREMSRSELEDFIAENSNGRRGRKASTKAVKAVKRGPGRPRKVIEDVEDDDEDVEETPRRRGRPKGSKNKTAVKRGRPAKSAKSSTRKRSGGPGRPAGSGPGTRTLLPEEIDWDQEFDFREGSIQNYILTEIRKAARKESDTAEIRSIVFDKLVDKIGDREELTFMNRATGKPHKGEAAEARLKYYISRTMFDYAVNTGQHEGSGNIDTYVRSGNGSSVKSRPAKRGRPRKVVDDEEEDEEEAPRRRGRPKGSTTKKRGPGRPKGSKNTTKRGPGRPKGSKNKTRRSSR